MQYDLAGTVDRRQRSGTDNVKKTCYNDHDREKEFIHSYTIFLMMSILPLNYDVSAKLSVFIYTPAFLVGRAVN